MEFLALGSPHGGCTLYSIPYSSLHVIQRGIYDVMVAQALVRFFLFSSGLRATEGGKLFKEFFRRTIACGIYDGRVLFSFFSCFSIWLHVNTAWVPALSPCSSGGSGQQYTKSSTKQVLSGRLCTPSSPLEGFPPHPFLSPSCLHALLLEKD